MERVIRGTAATISVTFYVDGEATDPTPDSATVEILREDGSELVASGAATSEAGTGKFSYTLTPAQTALLDTLTVRWTATVSDHEQTVETTVEIAGGTLFSIAEAKADSQLSSLSTDAITSARTGAEQAIEDACNVAFVPRYARQTLSGDAGSTLMLRQPKVSAIRSVSVDDTALTSAELAELKIIPVGIYNASGFARGVSNVVVGYEHGYSVPPEPVRAAALAYAKQALVKSPFDPRAIEVEVEAGRLLFGPGGVSGIPEVDRVVAQYGFVSVA